MVRQPLDKKSKNLLSPSKFISQLVKLHIKQKAPQMRCINIIIAEKQVQIKRKETP